MNIINYSRRLAQGVLVMSLALMAFTGVNAQCTLDPLPPYGPVPAITLPVDATAPGIADLNGSVLSSYFQSDCPFLNVRLYSAATGGTYLGPDESYDCSFVGTTFSVWLAVRNIFDTPGSESPRREVSVTIVDNTFPTITVPAGPFSRNADASPAGSCRYTIVGTEFNPTAVGDNCVGFTTSYRIDGGSWVVGSTLAGVQLNGAGAHSIQWRVIDASMNTTNAASFNVNIADAANPAITCPGNQTINTTTTTCNAVATGIDPTFTDNCGVTTLTWSASAPTSLSSPATGINYASGTTFALGTTTVTYTAKDAANNTVNCMFTVTVQDMTAPTFAGVPMNQMIGTSTASMTPAVCDGSYSWSHPTFTDNCTLTFPPASLTMALSGMTTVAAAPVTPGAAITQTFNGLGTTTVTYVATDNNGRTASASFTVTVNDDSAPVVVLPADPMINVPVSGTDCSKVITFTRPSIGAVSDCGSVTMTETVISGQDLTVLSGAPAFNPLTGGGDITVQFPTGLTEIEYCWVDNLSNSVCQTYSFFVDENVAPTAICQNLTRNIGANGQVTVLAVEANNGSTDNCGDITFNLVPTGMPATGTAVGDDIVYACANIGVNTFNLEVLDAAGNLSTTSCSVTITDNTSPVVSCPNDVTVNTDPTNCTATIGTLGNLVLNGNAVLVPGEYEDNCTVNRIRWTADNGASPAASPNTGVNTNLSAVVFKKGVTNVVYTLRDAGNNVEVCNFQVVVNDVTAPVATGCPTGPISLAVNTTFCSHIPSAPLWNVTWTDNCTTPVTNVVTTGGTPTNTYQQGETAITITATDAAGNVGTCAFVVDVAETTAPTALCKNVTVNLDDAPVTVTAPMINNGSTDNCTLIGPSNLALLGGDVTVTSSTCADIPVTLVVTDRDGNTATCTATIVVNDDIAPICTVNTPIISLNASGVATLSAAAVNFNSTDNCALHPTTPFAISKTVSGLTANQTSLSFACSELGSQVIYFKVTDKNGNTCTTSTTVTVEDNIDPVGNGPADVALSCEDVTAYLAQPVSITAVENCTYTVSAVSVSAPTPLSSPTCANHYQLVRSWTVTDVAGNTDLVQQIITVEDDSKPTITLPANVTLNLSATPGNCTPTASYPATVTDNCAGAVATTWTIDFPGTTPDSTGTGTSTPTIAFKIGINKITFKATDACGNSITAAMTVTVVDDVAPNFVSYNVPTTSTSYCNHAPFVYANTPGTCGYTFNWVRPWVGDLSDCSTFSFAAESIEAVTPTTLPGTVEVLNANFPWNQTNSLTEFVPVSISLPVGTTTFKYTATDAAGNVQTCSFNVQVQDTEAPTLSGIQTAILASICPTQTVPDYRGQVQINDNCPANVSLTQTIVSPNNIPWVAGVTTLAQVFSPATPLDNATFIVRISATDGVNAIATRDITVTLDDNVAPVPNVTNLPATNSNCGYIILPTPTAKTNDCGPGSGATVFGTPGGVSAVSETVNGMGNITSYRVTLPPNPGQPTCQTYFITWSYNDGNGNVATQPQTVTVCPDLIAPTAVCKTAPINVTLNPTTATLAVTDVDGGSFDTDNCGTFTLGLSKTSFTCADVSPNNTGFTTVVLTATATANSTQTDTCHARIRVIDNQAPVINLTTVPASFTVDTCAIGYVLPVAATVTATDNCSATVSLVQTSTQGTSGASKYNYTVTRTWTATDVYGNTSTAQQTITVKDTKKPVFATLTPASLMFNTALVTTNCSANTVFKVGNYISDCAPDNELSIVVNPAYYSLTDTSEVLSVGSHTISFTVTDPSGNSATSTVTIVVKDATKPIASCINGISVALNANGQAIVTPILVNNQSYDNCSPINTSNGSLLLQELDATNGDTIGSPASQLVFDCLEADNDTEYPIILWVKDAAGNFNFCETYVVIQDNVAPTLTCPPAKTIECSNNPAAFLPAALGNATATDNCPATLTLTYTDAPVNPGYLCGNRVRTFKTTDLSGNVATCTQVITVIDNKPPVFTTLPQNDTILCNDPLVVAPTLLATDNCTPADSIKITLVQTKSDSVGVCGKYQYKVTRKWTATDKCGNTNMHTQVVTVRDTLGPVFLGMPDTLKILTGNFPPSTNCTAPVAFNAAQFFSECALLSECTINSVVFKPALNPILTPTMLNVSGNYPIGNTKVIFTVTDPCGNIGKDSIVINVKDNSAPVMVCNNTVEIALSNNGQATLTPADVDLNSNDNCGIATRTLSKNLFDCEDLGVNQVILTATDIYGNANSCTVAVEVTAGPNTGFTLTTTNVVPTYFGATNGSVTAAATGGSGNFTYIWSTNATTASVTGLAAGAYTVTVTDAFTGCKQSATVTLADGPQVLFTVGNATGAQNTIVKVPVIVTNFQQLSGFTFSLNVPNATVGTIGTPALSNVTAALGTGLQTSVSGNTVSVLYLNPQGVNINLPNGTVLFNLCVQLSGASLGSSSPVNIENSPVQFTVIRATSNGPLVIPSDAAVNGSVQITQGLNDYDLGGDVYPWQAPTTGVPNVTINVTGPTTPLTSTTTTAGTYLFSSIVANTNTTTTATKSQAGNTKIDIIDQGLMLKHIFATAANPSPLTSPYQRVAADVNFDGQINIVDFALVQRLLLGTVQHIEGVNAKDWVFIPKSYAFPTSATTAFPNPTYPALPVFPQSVTHNPLIQDQLDDDLVAVRMGDLNGDAPLNIQQPATDDRSGNTLKFRLDEQNIEAGNTVSLAFKAKDFTDKKGYQLTFAFDPNVFELQDIEAGAVPGLDADGNFGTTLLSEGFLSTAWVNLDAVTIEDDATLFTLVFKALENVNELSQVLNVSNEVVSPLSVDANDEVAGVELEFTAAVTSTVDVVSEKMVVYQNQPNPFRAETTIGFRLPTSERTTIRVYTASGRLVKTIIGDFEKGYNTVQVRKGDLGSAGVFWYEVTSGAFSDRKKMIIID